MTRRAHLRTIAASAEASAEGVAGCAPDDAAAACERDRGGRNAVNTRARCGWCSRNLPPKGWAGVK
eukprot:6345965-Prymnesium_polylepis.1